MISIIVPVYNVEKHIKKCLDSIVNQTYKDLEIILVDDGSPDSSGAICDEYAKNDSRIKVIHKENGGQSSARNMGLDLASGEYVGFVDSDDTIELDAYEKLYNAISGVDIAIGGHNEVKENEVKTCASKIKKDLNEEELWQEIFGRLNNATWNKLYRRDLIKDIRFDLHFMHGEDLIFNILYLEKAKTGRIINEPIYNYFKRGDSITTGKFTRRKLLEIDSKDEALRLVKQIYPKMEKVAQKYCFRARMNISRNIYKAKQQTNYVNELSEYRKYLLKNYNIVKAQLKNKEKIEFFLFKNMPCLYKIMARIYYWGD